VNVLVIAPHPDDESIGCGGAILRHTDAGDRVHVVFLTSGEWGLKDLSPDEAWRIREAEARAAAGVLGTSLSFWREQDWALEEHVDALAGRLAELIEAEQPELVYAPHPAEWHPDHRAASAAVAAAATRCGISSWSVRGYEIWTPLASFDFVEDVTDVMPRKLEAIGHYESQLSPIDYRRVAKGLNAYRGALAARSGYAEAFGRLDDRDD
jgi:LmbE family N-acetylglucosaminyl deacetylase